MLLKMKEKFWFQIVPFLLLIFSKCLGDESGKLTNALLSGFFVGLAIVLSLCILALALLELHSRRLSKIESKSHHTFPQLGQEPTALIICGSKAYNVREPLNGLSNSMTKEDKVSLAFKSFNKR